MQRVNKKTALRATHRVPKYISPVLRSVFSILVAFVRRLLGPPIRHRGVGAAPVKNDLEVNEHRGSMMMGLRALFCVAVVVGQRHRHVANLARDFAFCVEVPEGRVIPVRNRFDASASSRRATWRTSRSL